MLNSKNKTSIGIPPISDCGQLVSKEGKKATLFNIYYHSVFSSSHQGFLEKKMDEIETSYDGILHLMNGLQVNKAICLHGIPDLFLTSCSGIIPSDLKVLLKKSI